ncbi:hypothetical protein, partial [Paenibacillus alba]
VLIGFGPSSNLSLPFWQAQRGFAAFSPLRRRFWLAQFGFDRFWVFIELEPAFLAGSAGVCSFSTSETVFSASSERF